MTAHNPINTSTQIRQSDSNRFGRVMVAPIIVGRSPVAWVVAGRIAFSIVGGSRLRAALGFIVESFIIREGGRGSARSERGGAPPPHNSVRGDHARNTGARHLAVNL